ncbi:MAG: DNA circularization N-terminal domain-containing protein [Burkholderiales bacterium]|nr:DNA circularization N-terminal domain-containing protein [Burkholderiales bacterium]
MADNNAALYNLLGITEQGLQLFNGWDLQNAQYNGVTFYIAKPFGSGNISNITDTVNTATALIGMDTAAFPLNNSLPIGTKEHLQEVRDNVKRKLVIHPLVNTNTNVIEDLGFEAERFNGIGLIIGDSYYNAYSNLYNYFLARQGDVTFENVPKEYRNVLQHPIRGKIENVFLYEFRVIHSSQRWKGILFEFTFVAQEVTSITKKSQSIINTVNQSFNLVIDSINVILTITTQIQAYGNMVTTYFNSTTPTNAVNFTNKTVPEIKSDTVPLLSNTATILYNNFRSTNSIQNYTNYYFENQTVDYTKFKILAPYANSSDDTTINALLQIYNENVQNEINQINYYGLNIQANDLITALKNSYVNLLDLCKILSKSNNSQYISYALPYTMSIREVCFKNDLDFNDITIIQAIITANPGKFASVNKIIADTVLVLPRN